MRAGRFVKQLTGYRAFIPAPLPPDPPVTMDEELVALLSKADRALGRLDGVTSVLPNPDLFVAMYVRHEAVLSSQIEGTQSTLEDVLEYEIDARSTNQPKDVAEVVNHVRAMNYGLQRLHEFPLSLPLIKELHAELMRGVRGADREPGEFRRSQNWIGPEGNTLATATFVPPPPHEMLIALDNFEKFLHTDKPMSALLHCGLVHAQFETIHPFLDGNGRVGRLLITFLLCQREILERPLLYLSLYLKAHRAEYYDRLTAVRTEGNWEGWMKFFFRGVAETSLAATCTARSILALRESGRERVLHKLGNTALGHRLFEHLFEQPVITVRLAELHLGCSYAKANTLIEQFAEPDIGFLEEVTGGRRNRLFRFQPYLKLFEQPWPEPDDVGPVESTLAAQPTNIESAKE
jgi:Fic family protein